MSNLPFQRIDSVPGFCLIVCFVTFISNPQFLNMNRLIESKPKITIKTVSVCIVFLDFVFLHLTIVNTVLLKIKCSEKESGKDNI